MFQGWVFSFWATRDAQDPAGVLRFSQYFRGAFVPVGGRLLLSVLVAFDEHQRDAVRAAQVTVNQLYESLRVHVVELDFDLVTEADIAKRVGLSRTMINYYVQGKRGPGGFPRPRTASGAIKVWDWGSVNAWLGAVGRGQQFTPPTFEEINIINGWLFNGYSRGMREPVLVPPPDLQLPPDPIAEQLARAFIGVTAATDLDAMIKLLNVSPDPVELMGFLDGLSIRMTLQDQAEWGHARPHARSVEHALRAELNAAKTVERHRSEMGRRLGREQFELNEGLYTPGSRYGRLVLAVRVICAGAGGHCTKERGGAYYQPGRTPGSPFLLLQNHGDRYGEPLLEGLVHDFGDTTDVFSHARCGHNKYVVTGPDGTSTRHQGVDVRMPNDRLKPLYQKFEEIYLRTGKAPRKPLILKWAPGARSTHFAPKSR